MKDSTDPDRRPVETLDELVLDLRHEVLEAEEGVRLRLPTPRLVLVTSEGVVQGSDQLVHALQFYPSRPPLLTCEFG